MAAWLDCLCIHWWKTWIPDFSAVGWTVWCLHYWDFFFKSCLSLDIYQQWLMSPLILVTHFLPCEYESSPFYEDDEVCIFPVCFLACAFLCAFFFGDFLSWRLVCIFELCLIFCFFLSWDVSGDSLGISCGILGLLGFRWCLRLKTEVPSTSSSELSVVRSSFESM